MRTSVFFDSWEDLLQIAITAPIVYLAVVLAVRLVGKRSTSQMNNFDWIVTVAVGSVAGSGILLKEMSISEVLLAIGLLLSMQYVLTWTVRNNGSVRRAVKAAPTLLVHDGKFIHESMRQQRITEGEIRAALRGRGILTVEKAKWVILEPDATFSIIEWDNRDYSQAQLDDIENFPPGGGGDAGVE